MQYIFAGQISLPGELKYGPLSTVAVNMYDLL